MKGIIDTHVHVWDFDRAEYPWLEGDTTLLNNSWHIAQLEEERLEAGVTAGVLVQASGNLEDTQLMLETAKQSDWILGLVGWLPLTDTGLTQTLLEQRFLAEPFFKGVRHQIHDEEDPRWLLQPAVVNSLKVLAAHDIPFDVVAVLPAHLEAALAVASQVPGLRMVIDHLGQPPISTKQRFGEWGEWMKTLANHPQFYAKISGLGTASGNFVNRTAADIKPYVGFVLEQFGVDRCFCGGDWPVSMLATTYSQTWSTYKNILSELTTASEREKIFFDNAKNFYNL